MPQIATADSAEAEMLRQFLRGRDVPCPNCGYNLRDSQGNRCPECGLEVALRLQLSDPKQGALLTGLIGVSAGAGLNGLLLIYFLMLVWRGIAGPGLDEFLIVNSIGFLVQGCALAAWLRFWRRIRRLDAPARWTLAGACWLLSLVNIVVFSYTIR